MFVKLFKQEFRATRNAMLVLCLTAIALGIAGGCTIGYIVRFEGTPSDFTNVMCALLVSFSVFFIAMCGVGAFVLMLWRFYKSRFTDEGYLTFTLPVSAHQVLLSSMVNSTVNMLIAFVTVCLSFGLMVAIGCSFVDGFWAAVAERLPALWETVARNVTWRYAGYLTLGVLDVIAGFASELIILMLAITIGAVAAKKHKILAAVGIYYGIHLLLSAITGITLTSAFGMALTAGLVDPANMLGSVAKTLTLFALFYTAIAVLCYFLTHYLITRKLNLP